MAKSKEPSHVTRQLFHAVFANSGKSPWLLEYRKDYIKDLVTRNQLKSRQLSSAILSKPFDKIKDTIESFDPQLKLFLSYYRVYESLGTKNIGIYHLPKMSKQDTAAILSIDRSKAYDFEAHDQWNISGYTIEGRIAHIALSKNALQPVKAVLHKKDFTDEVWDKIETTASELLQRGENLIEVKATVIAEKRSIVTVSMDLDKGIIEIGNDVFQADSEGNHITDQIVDADRKESLKVIAKYLNLSNDGAQSLVKTPDDKKPAIRSETNERLHKTQTVKMLIIRTMGKFNVENIDEQRLNEHLANSLPNQSIAEIKKNAAVFYDQHGTFEGFFQAFPGHDTDDAEYMHNLIASEAEILAVKAYALVVRDCNDYESDVKFSGHLAGKTIDHITYQVDVQKGEVEIRNGSYSEEAQRIFLDRVLELDQELRAGRPRAGDSRGSVSPKPTR